MRRGNSFALGLSGGIGSGKSTVSAMLTRLGATLVDADAIANAASLAKGITEPVADLRGSVEYKVAMAGVVTARAIATALARAQAN